MNKNAQLAVLMFPLIAIILSAIALYSFATFTNTVESNSEKLSKVINEIEINYNYVYAEAELIFSEALENCKTCDSAELKEETYKAALWRDEKFYRPELGNFFGKLRNKNFTMMINENGTATLKIENLFLESSEEYNKIQRSFNISLTKEIH